MSDTYVKEPTQAWVTTFAGMAINLCLGILYAWSMWGGALVSEMTLSAGDIVTPSKVISAARPEERLRGAARGHLGQTSQRRIRAEALKVKFGTASKEGYALLSEVTQKGEALKAGDIITHAGEPMSDPKNAGWLYLNNAEAATPFSLCVIMFALLMIPGGKIQDRISPKFGATLGVFLAAGCIIAGLMKSYVGTDHRVRYSRRHGDGDRVRGADPGRAQVVRAPPARPDCRTGRGGIRRGGALHRPTGEISHRRIRAHPELRHPGDRLCHNRDRRRPAHQDPPPRAMCRRRRGSRKPPSSWRPRPSTTGKRARWSRPGSSMRSSSCSS